jgi:hypothetical protein
MRLLFALLLFLTGCSSTQVVIRHEAGSFSVRDYLKTAYETLAEAETDTGGHRIRAQLETRAALNVLDEADRTVPVRLVPFEGPPTLAVALALLEHSEPELLTENGAALDHTRCALKELRAALSPRSR